MKRFHVHAHVADLRASIDFYTCWAAEPARTSAAHDGARAARRC